MLPVRKRWMLSAKWTVGEMNCRWSELSVKWTVGEMIVGEMIVGEMIVDEMTVGEIIVGEMSCRRNELSAK